MYITDQDSLSTINQPEKTQHNIQREILCRKAFFNLIITQNAKNLISGQEEGMENSTKRNLSPLIGEATSGKHFSTEKDASTLLLYI
jgi:hypothetical protein